jgi:methylated-DNA-[protein]-cysteine S-methyltransferase
MTGVARHQAPVRSERWFPLPLGWCHLQASEVGLVRVELPASGPGQLGPKPCGRGPNALAAAILETAESELRAYFAGDLEVFTVPVDLTGMTPFRQSVLRACRDIPCGQTMT